MGYETLEGAPRMSGSIALSPARSLPEMGRYDQTGWKRDRQGLWRRVFGRPRTFENRDYCLGAEARKDMWT